MRCDKPLPCRTRIAQHLHQFSNAFGRMAVDKLAKRENRLLACPCVEPNNLTSFLPSIKCGSGNAEVPFNQCRPGHRPSPVVRQDDADAGGRRCDCGSFNPAGHVFSRLLNELANKLGAIVGNFNFHRSQGALCGLGLADQLRCYNRSQFRYHFDGSRESRRIMVA